MDCYTSAASFLSHGLSTHCKEEMIWTELDCWLVLTVVLSAPTRLKPSLPLHSSVCLQQPCSQFYSTVHLLTLRNQGRAFSRLFPKPMGKCHTLILHHLLQLYLPDTFKHIYVCGCKYYSILNRYISMISNIKRHNIKVILFPSIVRVTTNKIQPSLWSSVCFCFTESSICILWVNTNLNS